jgi:hypothetical protein
MGQSLWWTQLTEEVCGVLTRSESSLRRHNPKQAVWSCSPARSVSSTGISLGPLLHNDSGVLTRSPPRTEPKASTRQDGVGSDESADRAGLPLPLLTISPLFALLDQLWYEGELLNLGHGIVL